MKPAILFCGGSIESDAAVLEMLPKQAYAAAADSGYCHAVRMGFGVDLLVGDFDSYQGDYTAVEVIKLPSEKDYTDTHTAVLELLARGFREIYLVGATGSRLDHTLANLAMLKVVADGGGCATVIDAHNVVTLLQPGTTRVYGSVGDTVSFLPLAEVHALTLRGFYYPLKQAEVSLFSSVWVSNEFAAEEAEVSFESGVLLMMRTKD